MNRFLYGLVALGLLLGVAGQAKAQYIFTTLDVPGSTLTRALDINASGQIVGRYDTGATAHGYLLSGGSYTTIDVPGSTFTTAHGINDSGQIVGRYLDGGTAHGYLLSGGSYATLDPPGSTFTQAVGINNSGQIV